MRCHSTTEGPGDIKLGACKRGDATCTPQNGRMPCFMVKSPSHKFCGEHHLSLPSGESNRRYGASVLVKHLG